MEQPAKYYDNLFSEKSNYYSHYKNSFYYVHWTQVIQFLKKINSPTILEIGCGPGQLAHYLLDEGYKDYAGFDFSKIAINKAKINLPHNKFWIGDALEKRNYQIENYNTIICLEVLEHIINDLIVIKNIPIGTQIIFSVPNFDGESHVRWFTNERQIKSRYYKLIDIKNIVRIGNIYICNGVRSEFKPNIIQYLLKSREIIKLSSFSKRIKHRIKNLFKL